MSDVQDEVPVVADAVMEAGAPETAAPAVPESVASEPVASGPVALDVEAQARRMGWVPREAFRGDPANWRPAEQFLERGMTLLPVLQQNYRTLDSRYGAVQAELRETRQALVDLTERARRADERALGRAMKEIESRRQRAVADGDTRAFAVAEQELQDLRDSTPPVRPAARPEAAGVGAGAGAVPPEVAAFMQANPWFGTNEEARQDAIAIHAAVDRQHPRLPLAERLEMTRRKVRQLHPALFENARRVAPAAVSPSRTEAARPANPRGFDALPAEVRREFDRYARALSGKGQPLTREEWAAYYWENEG
ncbi:hypothetical protein AA13595_2870 [Gluconacetobacter johannae DSM 13595]|uniref:Uncharacterized protein n=1 Tax=Gluconacetobacter johannae TaxID=112140 RepID=A0A7W4JA10_9PROT|nr:hypothetical protein [Gluconacetobacter johannae]MBB2177289.1 hypothetical protein [Gluconacetobacter johannae]GBQ90353.1 hypothetical protein AA13595_2870 [Gluconacetobacter johannae DSM 13595]